MNHGKTNKPPVQSDSFAELFEHAAPRPEPRSDAKSLALASLKAQWAADADRRKKKWNSVRWGVAATLLFGLASLFIHLESGSVPVIESVATVALRSGEEITVTTSSIGIRELSSSMSSLNIGDSLVTGQDSRLALEWNSGGSLRIDANTRLEFVSLQAIRLISGTVYFDSKSMGATHGSPIALSIMTPAGSASHIGTQFMTKVVGDNVTISVREGRVKIEGSASDLFVLAGSQMNVGADGLAIREPIASYAEAWRWVEDIAPRFDPDGRPVNDLLSWIARETGRNIHYYSVAAEQEAGEILHGFHGLGPVDALEALSSATDLRYSFIDERIEIRLAD